MYILSYFIHLVMVFIHLFIVFPGDRTGWGVSCLLTFIDIVYSIKISVWEVAC